MKLTYFALALLPVLVWTIQDDAEKMRAEKLKAIDDWTGKWKAEVTMKEPPEFRGIKMEGELDVKWHLSKTALKFDGWLKSDANTEGKKLEVDGTLSFNHAGKPEYSGSFAWSEDGRIALAHGDFKGRDLILDVDVFPKMDEKMVVKGVGENPRRLLVSGVGDGGKTFDFLEITLRRR